MIAFSSGTKVWIAGGVTDIARISDTPVSRLHELLPWNWKSADQTEGSVKAA